MIDFKDVLQNIKNEMMEDEKFISYKKKDKQKKKAIYKIEDPLFPLHNSDEEKDDEIINDFTSYNFSEQQALEHGFTMVKDKSAYNGRYFVKNNLIWIHNLNALKAKLDVYDEEQLQKMGYDVKTYKELHSL